MELCQCLQRLASCGLTIVAVIHQPRFEIFQLLSDVLLLGKGGQTVFLGPSTSALPYFEGIGFECPAHTNPPDFLMDVIGGDVACPSRPDFTPSELFDLWASDGQAALLHEERRKASEAEAEAESKAGSGGRIQQTDTAPPAVGINTAYEEIIVPEGAHHAFNTDRKGPWRDFFVTFASCLLLPLLIPVVLDRRQHSYRYVAGGVIGTTLSLTILFTVAAGLITHSINDPSSALDAPHGSLILLSVINWLFSAFYFAMLCCTIVYYRAQRDFMFIGHLIGSSAFGPLFIAVIWRRRGVIARDRYASVLGLGLMTLLLGCFLFLTDASVHDVGVYFYEALLPLSGIAMMIVCLVRHSTRLSSHSLYVTCHRHFIFNYSMCIVLHHTLSNHPIPPSDSFFFLGVASIPKLTDV